MMARIDRMAGYGKSLAMPPRVVAAPRRGAPMNKKLSIIDRPQRINLANYEQRLRKIRNVVALILGEIDDGLDQIEANRHEDSHD
jgi:hypothetical protein